MGGHNHHAKNCNFSANKHPSDIRPVVKLEFVHGGPEEKPRALYLSRFNCGGPILKKEDLSPKCLAWKSFFLYLLVSP